MDKKKTFVESHIINIIRKTIITGIISSKKNM